MISISTTGVPFFGVAPDLDRYVHIHTAAQIEAGMRFVIIVPESCAKSLWDSFLSVWDSFLSVEF
jgi:hypothetical protein